MSNNNYTPKDNKIAGKTLKELKKEEKKIEGMIEKDKRIFEKYMAKK